MKLISSGETPRSHVNSEDWLLALSMSLHITGIGNQRQDAALAGMIAAQVDRSLDKHEPNGFRYSRAQALTKQAMDLRGASSRNG